MAVEQPQDHSKSLEAALDEGLAVEVDSITVASGTTAKRSGREARALVGWMDPNAPHALSGRTDLSNELARDRSRINAARAIVAARAAGVDQSNLIEPPPPELAAHVAALRAAPATAAFWAEGWEVVVVDLARVCAFQPIVHTEEAVRRTGDATTLTGVAEVSLPAVMADDQLHVVYDQSQKAWVTMSRNPNLKITGYFSGQVNGMPAVGFNYGLVPSFMQVAEYNGRHFLRNGYHRAYGFLARGQRRVPVFWRRVTIFEELGIPQGMLPHDSIFGDRPPTLLDFHDDDVSASCIRPDQIRLLVVSAVETSPTPA